LLHQVGDLFELNVKLWCQKVNMQVPVKVRGHMNLCKVKGSVNLHKVIFSPDSIFQALKCVSI